MSFTRFASGEEWGLSFFFKYCFMEGVISFGLFYAVKGENFCPFQDFQGLQPKFKDFQGLEFSSANSRTFQDLKDRGTRDLHLSVRLVATVRE